MISLALNFTTYSRAFGCTPLLGGSRIIRSGFSFTSVMTFATSPAMKVQLFRPFSFAFSLAAATASSISSIPITLDLKAHHLCGLLQKVYLPFLELLHLIMNHL